MERLGPTLVLGLSLVACGGPLPGEEGFDESQAALEVAGILRFVNGPEATVEVLDVDVGLDVRAARGIVRHVLGRDGRRGTADDDQITSLAELDAISYVGPSAFEKLSDYVLTTSRVPDFLIEGVAFSALEAEAVVSFANGATFDQLDNAAALDARAARAIEAARPISALEQIAALPYVGAKALENLRNFATQTQPPGDL